MIYERQKCMFEKAVIVVVLISVYCVTYYNDLSWNIISFALVQYFL